MTTSSSLRLDSQPAVSHNLAAEIDKSEVKERIQLLNMSIEERIQARASPKNRTDPAR